MQNDKKNSQIRSTEISGANNRCAKKLRVPLRHLCVNEKSLKSLWLASIEWQELEKVEGLLEKFERSTKLVSMGEYGSSYQRKVFADSKLVN